MKQWFWDPWGPGDTFKRLQVAYNKTQIFWKTGMILFASSLLIGMLENVLLVPYFAPQTVQIISGMLGLITGFSLFIYVIFIPFSYWYVIEFMDLKKRS
ncbi:MAG TPA: hypothetical protein VJJ80_03025 [Patescibacteria group bacterium]|nr:hypothetical protein [Patescibacteria group bacterium]